MKKLFKPVLYSCIAAFIFSHPAQAQDLALTTHKEHVTDLFTIANNNASVAGKPLYKVNTKVARLFEKAYKNAENIQWFHNGNGYLAMFDLGGMKAHASFGKNGYWYYDARFGTETDLPPSVRKQVKSNYVDYTIGKATEVNVGGQKAWVVNVSDINNLVLVRIMDGALEELARYETHTKEPNRKARIVVPQ
jgi:hypothetical protein